MKELTRKQKLEFVLYCMNSPQLESSGAFYICNELYEWCRKFNIPYNNAEQAFPELMTFSALPARIKYWESNQTKELSDNQVRAIILSFIYNML